MFTEVSKSTKQHTDVSGNLLPLNKHLPWYGRSNGLTLLNIPPCNTTRSALHKTRVTRQKGRVTEQRTANVQMSRTVEVVKAFQPHFTQTHYNYKMPDLFWREYSLSRIFTDLILHNYRSNQSALMTRFRTDLRHQYGIFGGKSQTSFTRNATRAGSEEGQLFSQARPLTNDHQIMQFKSFGWPRIIYQALVYIYFYEKYTH